jgi:hypothetical protein
MHRATEHEFIRDLVSHPGVAADCLVLEFGNALYQELAGSFGSPATPLTLPECRLPSGLGPS